MTDPLFPSLPIPLEAQIACIERELRYREGFYPRWIAEKKMTQRKMDEELAAMRAVLRTLKGIAENRDLAPYIHPLLD